MSYQQMHRLRFYGLVGVDNHATSYGDEGHGCFPLCEGCWNKLTPEERLPYYRYLWELWKSTESEIPDYKVVEWSVIEKAVLSE